ncbi:protein of unknown function [Methylocaldum szegediense]|uniref:Uncharacterized protein n=1 Tax=Methylocaldum szegediense TaxID=73780 RepID=A0ABM9I5S4_9GAMM|nr:protein of unknown function [Methylocaldum szegediense]
MVANRIASRTETIEISFNNLNPSDQIPLTQTAWSHAHTSSDRANFINTHNEPPPMIDSTLRYQFDECVTATVPARRKPGRQASYDHQSNMRAA